MFLKKFSYSEFDESPRQWKLLEFKLNDVNLIVGANASGKTRTLNVISGLSKLLLSPKISFESGQFKGSFYFNNDNYTYEVIIKNGTIQKEKLILNNQDYINRDYDGTGTIYSSENKMPIKFKIPHNELIATRIDDIQYPYLNNLYQWASKLRHFRFAKEQEKQTLSIVDTNKPTLEAFKLKETDKSIAIFNIGRNEFKEEFTELIIKDFNDIGYKISEINLGTLQSIKVESPIQSPIVGLNVKETDRNGYTDQHEMSDGMFRALSILIHFNYYKLAKLSGTILIDDIGEGLDFERSSKLIKLLIEKSQQSHIQLILSTNDKFVMNNTNLDYWQVISREGPIVKMHNKSNSKNIFEDFKFTGLNNFDFFTTEFFKKGFN